MYRMVLYPVHPLIFKILFKKIGRVVLRPDLLFPSPCIIQSGSSKGQTGRMMPDVGCGRYPKIIVGATETRASRLYNIGC